LAQKKNAMASINPLGEVVGPFQLSTDLVCAHALVLAKILGVLPLEELHTILGDWLTSEMAVSSRLLILGLPKSKGHSNGTRACIESNFQHFGEIICAELWNLSAISLHKQRKGFGHANGIRKLDEATLGKFALHDRLCHLPADVCRAPVDLGWILTGESAATVGTPTTICVDDNLATSEARIALVLQ